MRLFHFSDDPDIKVFEPRPVLVPSKRQPGREWLNGPLVWAIDETHQAMYLFPRDCPRILLWLKPETTDEDRAHWFGDRSCRMLAYIEEAWRERVANGFIYRYELGEAGFENLGDAGMWVSRRATIPIGLKKLEDLPGKLEAQDVELIVVGSLLPLKGVWRTTMHASGLRLRGAIGWDQNWPLAVLANSV